MCIRFTDGLINCCLRLLHYILPNCVFQYFGQNFENNQKNQWKSILQHPPKTRPFLAHRVNERVLECELFLQEEVLTSMWQNKDTSLWQMCHVDEYQIYWRLNKLLFKIATLHFVQMCRNFGIVIQITYFDILDKISRITKRVNEKAISNTHPKPYFSQPILLMKGFSAVNSFYKKRSRLPCGETKTQV